MNGGSMRKILRPQFIGQVRKYVKEWTPLSTTFNLSPNPARFALGRQTKTGLFNIPELTSHEGFDELKERCVTRTDELIREALDDDRSRKMVEIFDELSDNLCKEFQSITTDKLYRWFILMEPPSLEMELEFH